MNPKHILPVGAAVLISVALLYLIGARRTNSSSEKLPTAKVSQTEMSPAQNSATQKVVSQNSPQSYGQAPLEKISRAWSKQINEPAAAEFSEWNLKYQSASALEKATLEKQGVMLAAVRQKFLAELIQQDPERALELAVPISVRRQLPTSVEKLLETRISGRGQLAVMGALPEPGKEAGFVSTFRTATIGEKEFKAFAYGRRLGEPTRQDIPVNGIAVGNLLAVNENPVRVLEPVEAEEAKKNGEEICSVSGDATTLFEEETPVEVGDEIIFLCQPAHAEVLNQKIIAAESGPASSADGVEPSAYTEGQKNLLLIRVEFPDLAGVPFADNIGTNLINGMDSFFREGSHHRASFSPVGQGSDYTPTFMMPNSASYYGTNDFYNQLRSHARTAAANFGYVLANYNFDVICMKPGPGWTWGGLGYVGQPGSWVRSSSFSSHGVMAHEVGHNYGLNHANFWDTDGASIIGTNGTNVEYGDNLDTMGAASAGSNHFNARYKRFLNWLKTNEVVAVTNSGTYRIFCHDNTNSIGLRAISVAKTGTATNYWVEFRQKFTSNKWSMSGAGIRWAHTNISNSGKTLLLDTTPGSNTSATTDKNDGALVIGRTLSDPQAGVHITPIGKGGTTPESLDVVVNRGTFPGNIPPTITIAASVTNVSSGATVNFTSVADDSNGDALAYYWDFGNTDFGTNGPTASKSWTTGEYVVRCTVTDMKGGVATDSVIIRVGSPTTFRISGTAMTNNTPLEGVRIFVPASNRFTYTDSDGTYNLTGLPAGSYTVAAQLQDYAFTNLSFSNPVSVGPNAAGKNFNTSAAIPPVITTQPQGRAVAVGSNVVFNVTATNAPLTYQWRFNGNNIGSATGSSFTILDAQLANAGNYSVVVSNSAVSVTSSNAALTVNAAPVLTSISDKTIIESALLTFTASATDANNLTYNLAPGAPAGATINSVSGVFSWTPNEAQGPGSFDITIRVTDNGTPPLNSSETFNVTVTETNNAPVLTAISNKFVNAGAMLTFTNFAGDSDLPANILNFSFGSNIVDGAAIDSSSGIFSWVASDSEILTTNTISIVVTDSGSPGLSDIKNFEVVVIPPPRIGSMSSAENGSIAMTWQTFPGKTYQMQFKDNLEELNWTDFGNPVMAEGNTLLLNDTTVSESQRFYRLRQLD